MKQKLLLLEDVHGLGRSGDLVTAKPGFVRNFLLPFKKAVVATSQTLKIRERLQEERTKKAVADKEEALQIAANVVDVVLMKEVKLDHEGHMYGSVTILDIVELLKEKGISVERRHVILPQAIKEVGKRTIPLRLNEDVTASVVLEIVGEPL